MAKRKRAQKPALVEQLHDFRQDVDTLAVRTSAQFGQLEQTVEELAARVEIAIARHDLMLNNHATVREVLRDLATAFEKTAYKLTVASSYTKEEVNAMSADEYRDKVLIPLGLGRQRIAS
jgi:hypothetical protein